MKKKTISSVILKPIIWFVISIMFVFFFYVVYNTLNYSIKTNIAYLNGFQYIIENKIESFSNENYNTMKAYQHVLNNYPLENTKANIFTLETLKLGNHNIYGIGFAPIPSLLPQLGAKYITVKEKNNKFAYRVFDIEKYDLKHGHKGNYWEDPWYKQDLNAPETNVYQPVYLDDLSHKYMVTYASKIYDKNHKFEGVLVQDLSASFLLNMLKNTYEIFPGSYVKVLIKRDGIITQYKNNKYVLESSESYAKMLDKIDLSKGEKLGPNDNVIFYKKIEYHGQIIQAITLKGSNLGVYCVLDMRKILFMKLIPPIVLLLLLIMLMLLFFRKVVLKIEGILNSFRKQIAQLRRIAVHKKYEENIDSSSIYEFEELQKSVNQLSSDILDSMDELKKKCKMENEYKTATLLQKSMLLSQKSFDAKTLTNISITSGFIPARIVGGDFYDYYEDDEYVHACIGDVSGKGLSASILATIALSYIRSTRNITDANIRVKQLNNQISSINKDTHFVSFIAIKIHKKTFLMSYCNAGHNLPLIYNNREVKKIKNNSGTVLGLFENIEFDEINIQLKANDRVFLYSDGISEAENEFEELFGVERIENILKKFYYKSSVDSLRQLWCEVVQFSDINKADDATMLTCIVDRPNQYRYNFTKKRYVNELFDFRKLSYLSQNSEIKY
ncbi:MAG: SpoIIE family protein phosphatase, partial [Fusobacteria bacterium]|nr:SpoIIE family protein phosphatase [Fusobacteriota bacterium]